MALIRVIYRVFSGLIYQIIRGKYMLNEGLLKETIDVFTSEGKKEEDVLWVGLCSGKDKFYKKTSWDAFKKVADFDYESGFGAHEINDSLIIVGVDWWLERHEYDGSEWWEFKTLPLKPSETIKIKPGWICHP